MRELVELAKKADIRGMFLLPTDNGLIKFFRYAFVGGIAFVVDYLFFAMFSIIMGEGSVSIAVSTTAGFIAGLITNFILSKKFVFTENARVDSSVFEFFSYGVIGVVGCIINILLMLLFVNVFFILKYIAKVLVALIVLVYNYLARKILLYR